MQAIQQFKNSHYLICFLSLFEKCQFDLNFTDKLGNTLLHYAACDRLSNFLRICLSAGCIKHVNTRDEKGRTPLHIAVKSGNKDAVDALLSVPGIIPGKRDNDGNSIIDTAIASDNIDMLLLLLKHFKLNPSLSLNDEGQNVLQLCFKHKAFRILNYYLNIDKSININLQDAKGNTCLHYLTSISKKMPNELIFVYLGVLFQLGIKPYIKNREGKTAYKLAFDQKNHNIGSAILAAQFAFVEKKIIVFLDEIKNHKDSMPPDRVWSIQRLVEQTNTVNELFQIGFDARDLLDKVNAAVDKIIEIDKLALEYGVDYESNKKIQSHFDLAYSTVLSEDISAVSRLRRRIEATLQEQAEARRRFSTFRNPQQIDSSSQTVAPQIAPQETLQRTRIPKH